MQTQTLFQDLLVRDCVAARQETKGKVEQWGVLNPETVYHGGDGLVVFRGVGDVGVRGNKPVKCKQVKGEGDDDPKY